ncbi:MAG: hypothetical protein GF417_12230 [Candidatus Latescibacteria bacterium]|nr:hypothetical protein [bacterium]MBD3425195.1 hypothetical protein [Candidatus Latescibacterota bacterium]
MTKRFIVLLAAAALLLPSAVAAQEPEADAGSGSILDRIEYTAKAGLSMPFGDMGDVYKMGFCLGIDGFVHYKDNIYIGGSITYNRWGVDSDLFGDNTDGSGSIIEFVPKGRYVFDKSEGSNKTFYAQAGLGFYRFAWDYEYETDFNIPGVDEETVDVDDSEIDLGICFGGGMIIAQSESFTWEVRPEVHFVFADDTANYFTLTGGFIF